MSVSRTLCWLIILAAGLCAQVFYVNDPTNASQVWSSFAPGQLYPGGAGPASGVPEVAAAIPLGPNPCAWSALPPCGTVESTLRGGLALDSGPLPDFYSTDGVNLITFPHPTYFGGGLGGTCLIYAVPPTGVVTGLAFDTPTQRLYYVDNNNILYFQSGFRVPFALAVAAVVGPVAPLLPGRTLTGLGFEIFTGTLWACDQLGTVYNINAATGAVIATFNVAGAAATCGGPTSCWSGLDVDNSNGPGTAAPPVCTGLTSATMHIAITDGTRIVDGVNVGGPTIQIANCMGAGPAVGVYGLAWGSDLQTRWGEIAAGGGTIPSLSAALPPPPLTAFAPTISILQPLTIPNSLTNTVSFCGIVVSGPPSGQGPPPLFPDILTLVLHPSACALIPPAQGGINNSYLRFIPNSPGFINAGKIFLAPQPGASGVLQRSAPSTFPIVAGFTAGQTYLVQTFSDFGVFSDCWQFRASL